MTRLPLLTLLLATLPLPALAQRPTLDARVDKVEKELRAVQRKVFPGGSPAFFEPEIAPTPPAAAPAGQAANAPLADLTTRVDGLEREIQRLGGDVEQMERRLTLASEQAAKDRAEFDARIKALEAAGAPALAPAGAPRVPSADTLDAAPPVVNTPSRRPPAADTAEAPAADRPAPAAVAKSGDPAEDAYMAGYRLWNAKDYPGAETALKAVVAKYPKHRRASYAQNLLGRAYLDEGRPANAAEAFASNYQLNPRGERAPESLYYLGQSLERLKKPADACKVYDEFDAAYGTTAVAGLKDRVATARRAAKCK